MGRAAGVPVFGDAGPTRGRKGKGIAMGVFSRRVLGLLGSIGLLVSASGCVGIYDNSEKFLNDPVVGTSEIDVLKTYATPSFATASGDEKIFSYKVRDTKYIVLVGLYDGYDLIVRMQNGAVSEVHKVQRPKTFAIFNPWAWAVTD